MLWYEVLFLLFLRGPAGPFEISSVGVLIQGELGSREERRAIWWSAVKRLSQVDTGIRASFLRAARTQFGKHAERDLDEGNPAVCRRFGLLNGSELQELAA